MAKKKKKKRKGIQNHLPGVFATWQDSDGLHAMMRGERLSEEMLEKMTREYQQQLRNSPLWKLWKEWVARFGKKEAERMLKECRVELR